jgi:outer membrane lipoprotein-sorting protein
MKFLRTVSTGRLLATIAGLIIAVAAGTAIAVAAAGPGPVPPAKPLATAIHQALAAPAVTGITADIKFTNNLIDSTDFIGGNADPILQGATGRLWLSGDHQLRLELQSDNGDAQIVVDDGSFWISDPAAHTVYEGTLPADRAGAKTKTKTKTKANSKPAHAVPTIASIQSDLNHVMRQVNVSRAIPSDVAGHATYTVDVSPKHDGGLLGSAQLAWDAVRGVPLRFAIYARDNTTPVLELEATNISYGSVPASDFAIAPPAGDKVVKISGAGHDKGSATAAHRTGHGKRAQASGVTAVARRVPFALTAPKSLVGLPRHDVSLLSWGGKPAALITYGENVGGIAVIEQTADAKGAAQGTGPNQGGGGSGLSLPTVSINGATGQELDTALGTMVSFTRAGISYTVIGSVPSTAADLAARALR